MMRNNSKINTGITNPVYTLSVTSNLSGIPTHSIRQYVDRGLILPYKKESSRHLFSDMDIVRLLFIHKKLTVEGLNIAGIKAILANIPCWEIRQCLPEEREKCEAYHSDTLPCWLASEKGLECRNTDCRQCEVYKIMDTNTNVKTLLQKLL